MNEQMEQILKMLPLVNKAADGILRVRELHKEEAMEGFSVGNRKGSHDQGI